VLRVLGASLQSFISSYNIGTVEEPVRINIRSLYNYTLISYCIRNYIRRGRVLRRYSRCRRSVKGGE
jgi:hypothetical protein